MLLELFGFGKKKAVREQEKQDKKRMQEEFDSYIYQKYSFIKESRIRVTIPEILNLVEYTIGDIKKLNPTVSGNPVVWELYLYDADVKKEDYHDHTPMILRIVEGDDEARILGIIGEVYPASKEDWDVWIGDGGLFGTPEFITNDTDENGQDVSNAYRHIAYIDEHTNIPVVNKYTFVDDGVQVTVSTHIYSRWLEDGIGRTEYVFVSRYEAEDRNYFVVRRGYGITYPSFVLVS